eukprot:982271_1
MGNTQSQDKLQKSAKTMRTQSMVINAECNQIRLACNTQSQDKLQKSAKTMRTQSMVINAECNQIRLACNKNKSLEILQLKLAVFEEKTFKKIKYDSKCAHSDCNEKAPKDFPSTDAYIC